MDGDSEDDVPENHIRKLPRRQAEDNLMGKKFCDEGDRDQMTSSRKRRLRRDQNFSKGEFTVLVWDPSERTRGYWCERDNVGDLSKKREIELFEREYVQKLVKEYDNE